MDKVHADNPEQYTPSQTDEHYVKQTATIIPFAIQVFTRITSFIYE